MKTEVTVFTTPKPFTNPHVARIQRNAIGSWLRLNVEVLLIADEPGTAETARDLGAEHLAGVATNEHGTPLVSSIFELAQDRASNQILAYVNADVLLLDDFLSAIQVVSDRFDRFLTAGQRWDLDVAIDLEFEEGWPDKLRERLRSEASLHPRAGSDYFAFPLGQYADLPPFALGRAGWDNWMIYQARRMHIPVVDATDSITAVHQSHDYAHLKGGLPHYRLPESSANVELGGGRQTVFTLSDATWKLNGKGLTKNAWRTAGFRRWLEAEIISRIGTGRRLRAVHAVFHPIEFASAFISSVVARISIGSEA